MGYDPFVLVFVLHQRFGGVKWLKVEEILSTHDELEAKREHERTKTE